MQCIVHYDKMGKYRLLKDITSPEAVTLIEENDNETFKLEYTQCNLCFVEFMCEMYVNGLCNLNMYISQQVVGYHVYQIYTMS